MILEPFFDFVTSNPLFLMIFVYNERLDDVCSIKHETLKHSLGKHMKHPIEMNRLPVLN